MLTQRGAILAEIEVTPGTDPTPAPADNAIQIFDFSISIIGEKLERDPYRNTLSNVSPLLGKKYAEITFTTELTGSGVTEVKPRTDPLFRSCAMTSSAYAGTTLTYTPLSTALKTCTIWAYVDGLLHKLNYCQGSFEFVLEAGMLPKINWTFRGFYAIPTDIPVPTTCAYDAAVPMPVSGDSILSIEGTPVVIDSCEANWDAEAEVASELDTIDYKVGAKSIKLTIGADFETGVIASNAIDSKDMTGYNYARLWIKSANVTVAGALQFLLDEHESCVSPLETINIPALPAGIWTEVTLPFVDPTALGAIICIGLNAFVDPGEVVIRLDDIRIVNSYTGVIRNININMNNTLAEISNINSASGIKGFTVTNRAVAGSFTLDAVLRATTNADFWNYWNAVTSKEIRIILDNGTGNNIIINMPVSTFDAVNYGDADGIRMFDIPYSAALSAAAGDDEISINIDD